MTTMSAPSDFDATVAKRAPSGRQAIAPIIGVKPIVPVISVALLISHSSRALLNMQDFHRMVYLCVALPAVPCIVAIALIYGRLSSAAIGFLLGSVILLSVPLRRWAASRRIRPRGSTRRR